MVKNTKPGKPGIPTPEKHPELDILFDPEEPVFPEEDPDVINDEDLFETPPYEDVLPGEGP